VTVPDADPPILPRLPRLPLLTLEDLVLCAEEAHLDRCMYIGGTARPCTCGVPELLNSLDPEHDSAMDPTSEQSSA